jgi:beta-glucosidase
MAAIDVENVLKKLTDQEKIGLLSGNAISTLSIANALIFSVGVDFWHTKALPEHGIPSLRLSDGPNGVRGTRFFNGIPAACFPCGTGLGATWDTKLLHQVGILMAKEAIAKGTHVILGPTINMQRSPLGGRGFESLSEDPVLAGLGAAAMVSGMQSKGVAATMKHFVCNDQEHERMACDSQVSQRALREIYMLPFQIAVRDARPYAFMTGYNKVNGTHVSENPKILQDILRDEWKWNGLVMSDWYVQIFHNYEFVLYCKIRKNWLQVVNFLLKLSQTHERYRFGTYSCSEAINAGLDLEMPAPSRWRGALIQHALGANKVTRKTLTQRARAVLELVNRCAASKIPENAKESTNDTPETSALLRKVAGEAIVLMKNDSSMLPLKKDKSVSVT